MSMNTMMRCPYCKHPDLRDMGFIRGANVFLCRKCGQYAEKQVRFVKLVKEGVLKSLIPG